MLQGEVTDKYSLRGRVFNALRENILSAKYAQNEELKETAVAAELGVSRTPVREALRQLELEGLVKIIPNKGAYVIGITDKDIEDIYRMRSLLEGLCARFATKHITQEQIEQLEEITYLTDFHVRKGNLEQLYELDNRFHGLLYEISESRMLAHVLSDFHHYVERVRKVSLAQEVRSHEFNEEHKAILQAMREHDAEKAEKLANMHIVNTIHNINRNGLEIIKDSAKIERDKKTN